MIKDVPVAESDQEIENTGGARVIDYSKEQPGGFFAIHRRGQGKWTRLGTAAGSALLILGSAMFIFYDVRANANWQPRTALIVAAVFVILTGALAFWLQNKPGNVSFLIDTDSEMKKVNWTSRKELIGSTKIVIGFMLLMALSLFLVDIFFGYFFFVIKVLKFGPFGQ
ncbi:MAG: preprotein translocase subunit SecE [Chthoniobacteraceae bacterium]|nr:preprotein translocase subunit SecE [Chthoniobacteraceae bacterium]